MSSGPAAGLPPLQDTPQDGGLRWPIGDYGCEDGRPVAGGVRCEVGGPVGWEVGPPVGAEAGRPVRCEVGKADAAGCGTAVQKAATLLLPPAAAARLRKATACLLILPCALACAQAVHSPNAAGPVASGPTGVAVALGCVPVGWLPPAAGAPNVWCANCWAGAGSAPANGVVAKPQRLSAAAAAADAARADSSEASKGYLRWRDRLTGTGTPTRFRNSAKAAASPASSSRSGPAVSPARKSATGCGPGAEPTRGSAPASRAARDGCPSRARPGCSATGGSACHHQERRGRSWCYMRLGQDLGQPQPPVGSRPDRRGCARPVTPGQLTASSSPKGVSVKTGQEAESLPRHGHPPTMTYHHADRSRRRLHRPWEAG
jgi:hypothetical protein